ncbi:ABC transporter substrate-binding protein [Dyadobacter sandarakinus]|uniref:ABC transporter substrate-binding protein n=1 Tax=Dyadobacter sandarakinus TaxID=2747268 RepID=A0ABX7I2P8_9BACT|nr:ABC transporter substrate-binding protein [Dyadobacter sandarakinus]QRR00362.1 ABC transporter substrate-binding protein [Dyadobacter sandarakinus]
MLRISFFLFFAWSFCLAEVYGQSGSAAESRYKAAIQDYKQGRYAAAMEKLAPITKAAEPGSYVPFAHYYYSLSAYQLKRYRESRQTLLQLQSKYPGWRNMNDVNYLLGAVAVGSGQYREGLDYLSRIKESSFSKDIQALKQSSLAGITDLAQLKELQKAYPDDKDIAIALIVFIENTPRSSATDFQLAEQLQKNFKISKKDKGSESAVPNRSTPRSDTKWTKGYLNVAVLLPFRLDEAATAKRRSNQFAFDYYMGLKLAKEQLATEGISVNLWAYDVTNDEAAMRSVSDNKNFRQSDLVIGPLYPATLEVAADFVAGSQAIMLNPLSTDGNIINASSNIYLGHPSISYQTKRAAEWMKSAAPGPLTAIYYGSTTKDSSMAAAYAAEWERLGGKVSQMLRIQPDREWLDTRVTITEQSRPGHVALFSSDGVSGAAIIEVLNGRKLNTLQVIATATSFNLQQSRLSRYASRLFLIEADYVDREKESIRAFQRNYYNLAKTFPSVYSYQGYDQLLFFARMMNTYRDKAADALRKQKYENGEFLLSGFNYTKANENQITPILRFNGSKWAPVDK